MGPYSGKRRKGCDPSGGASEGGRGAGRLWGKGPESHRPTPLLPLAAKELDALQQVWEATRDWEENWSRWKTGRFLDLQTEAMEAVAHGLSRRLLRLAKEYKARGGRGEAQGTAVRGRRQGF